jgi:hypothetical protein
MHLSVFDRYNGVDYFGAVCHLVEKRTEKRRDGRTRHRLV